jgi:hypothetical protein
VRVTDGLIANPVSGRYYGVSNFKSHKVADCVFKREEDGALRPGDPAELLKLLEALPGAPVVWEDQPDTEKLLDNLFLSSHTREEFLEGHLMILCEKLQSGMAAESYGVSEKPQVPFGAYGIVAFCKRKDMTAGPSGEISKAEHAKFQPSSGSVEFSSKSVAVVNLVLL